MYIKSFKDIACRQGKPRLKTVENWKRCASALDMVHWDKTKAMSNLLASPPVGANNKRWSENTIEVYVNKLLELDSSERQKIISSSAKELFEKL